MQEQEFRKHDGDPLWLKGLQHLPTKIRNLLTLNKLLAHQAWFVKPELIKASHFIDDIQSNPCIMYKSCEYHVIVL